ncbi:DNA-directed RNA polymerase subunit H [uncultured archaeon]|nr:DNA-directed RNA polymerase subunit H [uncultured archaeon]
MPDKKAPEHELIPEHSIISKKEGEEILSTYKVSRLQIPKIKAKDAALDGMGAKAGDIVKVTRADGSVNYRLVV